MRLALVLCFGVSSLTLGGCEMIADSGVGEIFGGGGPEIVWMHDQDQSPVIDYDAYE